MNKSLNQNTTIILNTISTFLIQGVAFFTTPLFSRLLGTDQYGEYSLFLSWLKIFSTIYGLYVGTSLATARYKYEKEYKQYRSSTLILGTMICIIFSIITIIFSGKLTKLIGFSASIIIIMALVSTSTFVITFANSAFIYEKKPQVNLLVSAILTIDCTLLQLLFIKLSLNNSLYLGMIYGYSIPYIIVSICLWLYIFLSKPFFIHFKYAKYALLLGIPTVFHVLSNTILSQSDRIMMKMIGISSHEIGIYSLYYNLSLVLAIILSALNNSWTPYYFDYLNQNNKNEIKQKSTHYIELFTVLTLGFLLLSREVGYAFGNSSFWSGIEIIPLLVLSVFFMFMYQFPVNFEFYYQKNLIIAIGTVFCAILNIILNIVLIPPYGMYGAVLATVISYMCLFIAHYIIVTKFMQEKSYLKIVMFIPSLLIVFVGIISFYVLKQYWLLRWLIGISIGLIELKRIYNRKSIF